MLNDLISLSNILSIALTLVWMCQWLACKLIELVNLKEVVLIGVWFCAK